MNLYTITNLQAKHRQLKQAQDYAAAIKKLPAEERRCMAVLDAADKRFAQGHGALSREDAIRAAWEQYQEQEGN